MYSLSVETREPEVSVEKPEGYDELMDKLIADHIKVEYIKPEFHGLYGVNVRRISIKEMEERFPPRRTGVE